LPWFVALRKTVSRVIQIRKRAGECLQKPISYILLLRGEIDNAF